MDDILFNIFRFINDGFTYKSVIFTCKDWKRIINIGYPSMKNKLINHLQTLLLKYPNKLWDWDWISSNPNITLEFIEKYPDKPWHWICISGNPNITMEFIEKYPDKRWNWPLISSNLNMTIEIIEKYPEKPWNWYGISYN